MRIICISDTHSLQHNMLHEIPKGDVLIHAGDISNKGGERDVTEFIHWFQNIDYFQYKIFIAGNHDCNLNNKSREDTLSPIIDLVKKITPNLHYWKKTGVYTMDNVDFGVMSIFDIDKEGKQITHTIPNPKDLDIWSRAYFQQVCEKLEISERDNCFNGGLFVFNNSHKSNSLNPARTSLDLFDP